MVELLARVRVAKQTLSRLLNDLVARGLIARQPNVRDRRQRLLELTKAGRELEEALHGRLRRRLARAYRAAAPRRWPAITRCCSVWSSGARRVD